MAVTTRKEIVKRAKTIWPLGTVPYSMNAAKSPTRHRQDCSGFVSAALGLPTPGENTVTLVSKKLVSKISWDEAEPGDLVGVMGSGTAGAAGHVRVIIGTPKTDGQWVCIEQMGGRHGPVRTTYKSFGSAYLPYRSVATTKVDVTKWPLPSGHYFGPIDGPNESRGGWNASEIPWIKEIQKRVKVLGFDPGAIDGQWGPNTTKAVVNWKKSVGLGSKASLNKGEFFELFAPLSDPPPPAPDPVTPDPGITPVPVPDPSPAPDDPPNSPDYEELFVLALETRKSVEQLTRAFSAFAAEMIHMSISQDDE